jgi:hypothetical protein
MTPIAASSFRYITLYRLIDLFSDREQKKRASRNSPRLIFDRLFFYAKRAYGTLSPGVSGASLAGPDSEELPSPCWLECRTSRNVEVRLKKRID